MHITGRSRAAVAALVLGAGPAVGIGVASIATAEPAPASPYHVTNTSGVNLNIRSAPSLSATVVGTLSAGSVVDIACQSSGDPVTSGLGVTSAIWDRLNGGGYISDLFTDTPGVGEYTAGIPLCDASGTPAALPTTGPAPAADFHGVNWASSGDNFTAGPVVPVGLTPDGISCDGASYQSVHDNANAILSSIKNTLSGVNTIRFPINPASVVDQDCGNTSTWWDSYKGAIDAATQQGMKVILSYWEANSNIGRLDDTTCNGGQTDGTTCFNNMWNIVVDDYASNPNVYFEPMNEPHGYSAPDWERIAVGWVTDHAQIPRGRVIISGAGYNGDLTSVGEDPNLDGTLLSLHDYNGWCQNNDLHLCLGQYASRTIVDEFGATMANGTNYNNTNGSGDISYVEQVTEDLRSEGVGSVYWPGLGGKGNGDSNGDSYRLLNLNSDNSVSETNPSGVDRVRYGWGASPSGATPCSSSPLNNGAYVIDNSFSEDAIDVPQGNPANGVQLEQWPVNNGSNQKWQLTKIGCDLYSITSVATGKSIDITSQSAAYGAQVQQWDYWQGGNQQFVIEPVAPGASRYVIASLDSLAPIEVPGFSSTAGTVLDQWGWNGGTNQQWSLMQTS